MTDIRRRAGDYLTSRARALPPHSDEEYFSVLLDRALRASAEGNYGIAALLALRCQGLELISLGQNSMRSDRAPEAHAEVNALREVRRLFDDPGAVSEWRTPEVLSGGGSLYWRRAAGSRPDEVVLYTTLEPCPMCTVAILNARLDRVVVALPDTAGGLAPDRLARLPAVWGEMAKRQALQVRFLDGKSVLVEMLDAVLFESKRELDETVMRDGVLGRLDLCTLLRAGRS